MLTVENKQYRFYTHDPKLPTITINLILSNENGGELSVIFPAGIPMMWMGAELLQQFTVFFFSLVGCFYIKKGIGKPMMLSCLICLCILSLA